MSMHRTPRAAMRLVSAVLALFLVGAATAACQESQGDEAPERGRPAPDGEVGGDSDRAQNVVFIVGDGMGIAHREVIRLTTVGREDELVMNQLQYQGWTQTDPADPEEAVTDSAAAATALATGVRTSNGAIAVDLDGDPVTTLLERAERAGKATGVVTTSEVTDATPAAFGSHALSRDDHSEIAQQYLEETELEVILGGGEDWWYPAGNEGRWSDDPPSDPTEASRGTAGDLVDRAQQLGYQYVSNAEDLEAAEGGMLLGLFANEEMFEHADGGPEAAYEPEVPLPVMAAKALEVLSQNPDGFFLVLEEEGIDAMAHRGNTELMIEAGRALDETVDLVRDLADEHGSTLIVVVGDHETGGLAIEPDDEEVYGDGEGPFTVAGTDLTFAVDWTTSEHTGEATPAGAEGPGSSAMVGVREHTDIHDLVRDAM